MESNVSTLNETNQLMQAQKIMTLEKQIKNGISWFYWIAGLSILNTLIFTFGGNINFVVGLAITQFLDGFASGLAAEFTGNASLIIRIVGFAMNAMVVGIFIVFGILGNKRIKWAIIVGMVIYLIDGLIFLAFGEWFSVFFHGLGLSGLWAGLRAINDLRKLETSIAPEQLATLRTSLASVQQASKPASLSKTSKTLAMAIIVLVALFLLLVLGFSSR